jgi:LacI family transcriptional regulator
MARRTASDRPSVPRRIGVLIAEKAGYKLGVLKGVAAFARRASHWQMLWQGGPQAAIPRLGDWGVDGIIADIYSKEMGAVLQALRCPIVSVSQSVRLRGVPRVSLDERAVGALAAEHFLERSFERFACVSAAGRWYPSLRADGFAARLAEAGAAVDSFRKLQVSARDQWMGSDSVVQELQAWLQGLPPRTALFATRQNEAVIAAEVAAAAGVPVPDSLAILSGEDDHDFATLVHPPLSGIELPVEQVGRRAAARLDAILQGRPDGDADELLAPFGVEVRQSSDVLGVDEPALSAALRYIRAHFRHGIRIDDVARAAALSRSSLERLFRQVLDRTPLQEVARLRIDHARRLLARTDLPIAAVARESGFSSAAYFCKAFRATTDASPGDYRRGHRPDGVVSS